MSKKTSTKTGLIRSFQHETEAQRDEFRKICLAGDLVPSAALRALVDLVISGKIEVSRLKEMSK